MRATEFITERKKKRKSNRAYGGYFYPGYGYGDNSSGDAGGDGGGGESVNESPEVELAKRLPSLAKHDYNTIDDLMRKIAKKHKITSRALSDLFKKKYRNTPDSWIKGKLDESLPGGANRNVRRTRRQIFGFLLDMVGAKPMGEKYDTDAWKLVRQLGEPMDGAESYKEFNLVDLFKLPGIDKKLLYVLGPLFREDARTIYEGQNHLMDMESEVGKFVDWTAKKLNLKKVPTIELSMDTEEAQGNHHTGGHVPGEGSVWVYAKNRNLVDILRTVFHELVHVRQHEIGMIKPGDSYPGSPIEAMADMLAGKYIKIYGEKNNHIFQ
jgi:hypothetical protein